MGYGRIFRASLLTPLLALGSSLAQASAAGIGTFSFTPILPPSSPVTEAIPTLGDAALIALGLLLIVIAVRMLRTREGQQRMLCIAVLGGGITLGLVGAGRASALVLTSFVFGADPGNYDCAGITDQPFSIISVTQTVTNNCTVSGKITTSYVGPPGCSLTGSDCDVLAPGASCTLPQESCVPP